MRLKSNVSYAGADAGALNFFFTGADAGSGALEISAMGCGCGFRCGCFLQPRVWVWS